MVTHFHHIQERNGNERQIVEKAREEGKSRIGNFQAGASNNIFKVLLKLQEYATKLHLSKNWW